MKENYVEPMVVDKNGNIYYSAKCINELEDEKSKEIKRLKGIIKEAIEYIEEHNKLFRDKRSIGEYAVFLKFANKLLEILDKVGEE